MLPLGEFWKTQLGLLVASDLGVPEMFAGHQHASRRCAYGCSAAMLRESHSFGGEPIEVWRLEFLLAIATQLAPP
jgi:hypothetical protein